MVTSKITSVDAKPVRVAPSTSAPKRDQTADKPIESNGPASEVQLTSAARSLAAAEQSLASLPAVNDARVAAVKRRLDSGEYRIDAQRIADKLLHLESDLARRNPVEHSNLK